MIIIDHGSYRIQRYADREEIQVRNTKYGRWMVESGKSRGPLIRDRQKPIPAGATSQTLKFSFLPIGYFTPDNVGHFAFILRGGLGDANGDGILDLDGKGFVIGNVSQYPQGANGCGPAPYPNCATVESFWPMGNCVYGETASSPIMKDGEVYDVVCEVKDSKAGEKAKIITLSVTPAGSNKTWTHTMFDYNGKSLGNTLGFTILEVFSKHDWVVVINNLVEEIK